MNRANAVMVRRHASHVRRGRVHAIAYHLALDEGWYLATAYHARYSSAPWFVLRPNNHAVRIACPSVVGRSLLVTARQLYQLEGGW